MRGQGEQMSGGWRVGIDIGGTFTDVVAVAPDGATTRTAKVDTRTDDRVLGLLAALEAVGLGWGDVGDLIHGTTMVTNAIVEDRMADVALVATRGFSDTLAIGRQNRRHLYRLDLAPKPAPQPASPRMRAAHRRRQSPPAPIPQRPAATTPVSSSPPAWRADAHPAATRPVERRCRRRDRARTDS